MPFTKSAYSRRLMITLIDVDAAVAELGRVLDADAVDSRLV